MDHDIGRIMQALRRTGLANDTLVFITSDNGPWDVRHFKRVHYPDASRTTTHHAILNTPFPNR